MAADKQQQGGSLELLLGEIDDLDELASNVLGDPRRDRVADEATLTGMAAAVQAAARTVAVARGATVRVQAAGQVEVVVAEEAGGTAWVAPRDGGGTLVGLRVPPRPAAEPDPLNNAVNT